MGKNDSKFDHRKAAALQFPGRLVTSDVFWCEFADDRALVALRDQYDLLNLMRAYQQAFFDAQKGDEQWITSVGPAIVSMCTDGCKPFLNVLRDELWTPPEADLEIPLKWLGQALRLEFCGRIGDLRYYDVRALEVRSTLGQESKVPHGIGSRILADLPFGNSDLARWHCRHVYLKMDNKLRLSIPLIGDGEADFGTIKEAVQAIAMEVFEALGEISVPAFALKMGEPTQKEVLRISADQLHDQSGPLRATMDLSKFISGSNCPTMEIDVAFDINYNAMAQFNRALGQQRGVEAMNLFAVRAKQLARKVMA